MAVAETDQQQEIERLRARVAALEQELVAQAAQTERIVATVQERTYWLDRWHLDLDALMRKPGAAEARWLFRAFRKVVRTLKQLKWRLTRSS